ncbi:ACP S-malonyltransferase [Streptomyces profundus]|uniref:ACP S-malonyltransferase n=1 Tax=Streptomyces profundus TaxID=2867410 RepID=UPI001D16C4F5|nr:ACP S-malonyltransferase [Streptomyces sp. MA3_2.13]UED87992.1 ACP S-malonyltransferase [Streptomyces sp. MA3_2.13]
MALGYLLGGGVGTEPHGIELHGAYPVMRRLYERIAGWTGLTVGQILEDDLPEPQEERGSVGSIRETALALAVHDILAEQGVHPSVLGGLSLGAMTSSCLAGALTRQELFGLLRSTRRCPDPDPSEPAHALAIAAVPAGQSVAALIGETEGVHVAGDMGDTADRALRIHLLGGLREPLAALAGSLPEGLVTLLPGRGVAQHTPLRAPFRAFVAPYVDAIDFAAPQRPVLSCLDPGRLASGDEVRDLFRRNPTTPISLPYVYEGMREEGVQLGVVVGPAIPAGLLAIPFPVVHVEQPEHIEKVVSSVFELGIEYPETGVGAC